MSYNKNKWVIFNPDIPEEEQPDAFITKKKLDNMEDGIEAAHKLAEQFQFGGIEIGEVVEGEAPAAEIVDGKLNLTIPKGLEGPAGEDGKTPVKGEDYFTEEDVNEIKEAVLDSFVTFPFFSEEINAVFACGHHINVEAAEEKGKLRITWASDGKTAEELIVPEGIKIIGGGLSDGRPVYFPATSITLNSGYVDNIIGGCYGNGAVGHATIIVNGGTFKYGICGGGMHWGAKNAHYNKVGHAEIIVNNTDGEALVLYAGASSGVCSTGVTKATINGGSFGWVTAGGSNGNTCMAELIINDGTFKVVQGCNRGNVNNIKITVNGGTIEKLFAGGESGDSSVTATYDRAELIINGGTIKSASAGTNGGVESTEKVSGTYVNGTINDASAAAMNLRKVATLDELYWRLVDLELTNAQVEE